MSVELRKCLVCNHLRLCNCGVCAVCFSITEIRRGSSELANKAAAEEFMCCAKCGSTQSPNLECVICHSRKLQLEHLASDVFRQIIDEDPDSFVGYLIDLVRAIIKQEVQK